MCKCRFLSRGILSGLVAGFVFTLFLIVGGMTETLGAIIGMPNKLGGFLVHFVMSMVAGVAFAIIFGCWATRYRFGAILGVIFGFGMWIAGPLTLLPYLASGVPLFSYWTFSGIQSMIQPLVGHLVFGLVLGVMYTYLKKRDMRN